MTDRNRLIELITKEVPRPKADALADHLLAKGVIVPPCKVGDKIYWVANHITNRNIKEFCIDYDEKNDIGVCEFTVYGFMKREERNLEILIEEIEYYNIFYLCEKDIGKTVFLTKEETEAKLKELGK